MIKPIVKMEFLLNTPSEEATATDLEAAQDLLDTLAAYRSSCVGMAGNMIGVRKRIIVFTDGNRDRLMLNPQIIKGFQPYKTEEGCLSLTGVRPTKRFKKITVRYQDTAFQWHEEQFSGYPAQIIQHEIDHCNGILI